MPLCPLCCEPRHRFHCQWTQTPKSALLGDLPNRRLKRLNCHPIGTFRRVQLISHHWCDMSFWCRTPAAPSYCVSRGRKKGARAYHTPHCCSNSPTSSLARSVTGTSAADMARRNNIPELRGLPRRASLPAMPHYAPCATTYAPHLPGRAFRRAPCCAPRARYAARARTFCSAPACRLHGERHFACPLYASAVFYYALRLPNMGRCAFFAPCLPHRHVVNLTGGYVAELTVTTVPATTSPGLYL